MFNALNRFISRLDGEPMPAAKGNQHGGFGFQVLRNTNQQLPIEPWFDFIVGINGRVIVRTTQQPSIRRTSPKQEGRKEGETPG